LHVNVSPWRYYLDVDHDRVVRLAKMWFNSWSRGKSCLSFVIGDRQIIPIHVCHDLKQIKTFSFSNLEPATWDTRTFARILQCRQKSPRWVSSAFSRYSTRRGRKLRVLVPGADHLGFIGIVIQKGVVKTNNRIN
jgi:hypothetical protein